MREADDFWYVLGEPEKQMQPKCVIGDIMPQGEQGEGQLWCGIAKTPYGLIPGKVHLAHEQDYCYYVHDNHEYRSKNMVLMKG